MQNNFNRTQAFRSTFNIVVSSVPINYTHSILAMGSCFAENIGNHLKNSSLDALVNPLGIVFNPVVLAKQLDFCLQKKVWTSRDLTENKGIYHSFLHHSDFSSSSEKECVDALNLAQETTFERIKNADFLLFTFGSTFAYFLKENKEIVANCHQFPASLFEKKMIGTTEIIASFQEILRKIRQINPNIQCVFTLSPVRHWKDGAIENQRSKASLLLAIHELCEAENNHYFPAYELLLDDLRDYRFYGADLLHPNKVAIDYIWKFFVETYFSDESKDFLTRFEKLQQAENHRPRFPNSEQYLAFAQKSKVEKEMLLASIENLRKRKI